MNSYDDLTHLTGAGTEGLDYTDSINVDTDRSNVLSNGFRRGNESAVQIDDTNRLPLNNREANVTGRSVQCPTCRGVGFVTKEQENQLVALIPLKDKRLKPRRTWLYVLTAVGFCTVAASLVIFFVFPRDVTLSSNVKLLLPSNLTINTTEKYVNFYVTNVFNVSNSNYISIDLMSYTLSVIFDTKVLNATETKISDVIPLRDMKSFDAKLGITFDKSNGFAEMANVCSLPITFLHERYMFFQITLTYSFLGRNQEASFETTPLVSCGRNSEESR